MSSGFIFVHKNDVAKKSKKRNDRGMQMSVLSTSVRIYIYFCDSMCNYVSISELKGASSVWMLRNLDIFLCSILKKIRTWLLVEGLMGFLFCSFI